jgi:geranylgeranylglycerol-phosphate geranylgeranyltransferase
MQLTSRIPSFIKITRPVNVLITFITIIVAAVICSEGNYPVSKIFFAAVSAGMTAAAGNVINDIFDLEIDKINRPKRPLPLGNIKISEAVGLYIGLVIFSIFISSLINLPALIIEIVTTVLLFLYSILLKKKPLAGNLLISFLTGLAFIYGGVAVGNVTWAVIPAVFALLINLLRELVKDMEDLEGDSAKGAITFPGKYGNLLTKKIIFILAFILMLATLYPFVFRLYRIEYFIIVMAVVNPVLVYFLKSLFSDDSRKNLNKLSFVLKLNMVFGLIAIYLGK